jgi:hypothetical protein
MSDLNLLLFGCSVSFVAVAGAYVYLRECFTAREGPKEPESRRTDVAQGKLRDVA